MLETPEKSSQPTRLRNLNMALSIKDVKRTARMLRKQDLNRSDLGSDPLETLRSGSDLQMEVSKKDPKGDVKSVQRPVDLPEKSLLLLMMLSAMVGIEGRYISLKRGSGTNAGFYFQVDSSMDLALQELAMRVFPLCESFLLIDEFVESRYQFKKGLVKHAFAAALRALLLYKQEKTGIGY